MCTLEKQRTEENCNSENADADADDQLNDKNLPKPRRLEEKIRIYVQHNYKDHYNDPVCRDAVDDLPELNGQSRRGVRVGTKESFTAKLYEMLSRVHEEGIADVVSWQPHGRCFVIRHRKKFVETVMPKYFKHTKFTSFQRQINLYGFCRLTRGLDRGGYYHELFLRGRPDLCKRIRRQRVKGTGTKPFSSPSTEPCFSLMEPCLEFKSCLRPKESEAETPTSGEDESLIERRSNQHYKLNKTISFLSFSEWAASKNIEYSLNEPEDECMGAETKEQMPVISKDDIFDFTNSIISAHSMQSSITSQPIMPILSSVNCLSRTPSLPNGLDKSQNFCGPNLVQSLSVSKASASPDRRYHSDIRHNSLISLTSFPRMLP